MKIFSISGVDPVSARAVRCSTPCRAIATRRWVMRLIQAAALLLPSLAASASVVFTNLHSFQSDAYGAGPLGRLAQGSDGYFYGMTYSGGTHGQGTVFKITTNGVETTLYSFTGGNDGANPSSGGLVQGTDGYIYGTTEKGGTNGGNGTIFKITTNGDFTTLYSFTGGNDGAGPSGGLVQGGDGNFYGTTYQGGTYSAGTVFNISTNGVLTTLYSFTGGTGDGGASWLTLGSDGYFYGTAPGGSTNGANTNYGSAGSVFRISTNGVLTNLYSFTGADDGGLPFAGVVQANDGYIYGTTFIGGVSKNQLGRRFGTVFKISTNGSFTSLHSFSDTANDGEYPNGLAVGADGNLYGTTRFGDGTLFRITTNGALTNLYSFSGNDGDGPTALALGSDGNLYGTTGNGGVAAGGLGGVGTVFKINTNGTLINLYSFPGSDGLNPSAALAQGSDGNFYGTTYNGGATPSGGFGTVFELSPNGELTSLYAFTGGYDGANPSGGLVQGSDGNFYGTTSSGGGVAYPGYGTVFELSTNGELTSLYSFTGGYDGANPEAGLVEGGDGNFYGTTYSGGANGGYGTVFRINTNGELTTLYSFTGNNDGRNPSVALAQGSDGNFYGTTSSGGAYGYGTVFAVSPTGALTTIYSFTGGSDGGNPEASLVEGSDGNFYGTTYNGGTTFSPGYGTVFKISAGGAFTSLYSFTGGDDGANPQAALVEASDGDFYGTTSGGGTISAPGYGTAFKISPSGAFTSLYSFTGGNDGANPEAGLVEGRDGYFYGAAYSGGDFVGGTVFKFSPAQGSFLETISPSEAVNAGAQWQVDGGAWQDSGAALANLSVGGHTVSFKPINGWTTPASQTVSIKTHSVAKAKGIYAFSGQGTYNGLFMQNSYNGFFRQKFVTGETTGMLSALKVSGSGTYSGQLSLAGVSHAITGVFNRSGQASNYIQRAISLGGPLTLEMTLNWNDSPPDITGTVSGANGGPWTANLTAELAGDTLGSADYTLLMPPVGDPPGYGYMLITNHAGAVVLGGTLADGTPFSQSVPISVTGDLPVYAHLYNNTGLLTGWIGLMGGAPTGNLTWIKEASPSGRYASGFTNIIAVQGSPWINPLPRTAAIDLPLGQLAISGGGLLSPLSFTVAVNNNNALVKMPGSPTNSLTGSINPKTGLLTITFGNGDGKATTAGTGAALQNAPQAAGFFLGKTNAGTILLTPEQ